jgi:hypothetical protein
MAKRRSLRMSEDVKTYTSDLDDNLTGRKGGSTGEEVDDAAAEAGILAKNPDKKDENFAKEDAKAEGKEEDEDETEGDPDDTEGEDGGEESADGEDGEDKDEDKKDDEDDDSAMKSLADRIAEDEDLMPAIEVSDVLKSLAEHLSEAIEESHMALASRIKGLEKSLLAVTSDLSKSLESNTDAEAIKAAVAELHEATELIKSMSGELDEQGARPRAPKTQASQVLHKSNAEDSKQYTKAQKADIICKGIRQGLCEPKYATRLDLNPSAISDDFVKSLEGKLRAE